MGVFSRFDSALSGTWLVVLAVLIALVIPAGAIRQATAAEEVAPPGQLGVDDWAWQNPLPTGAPVNDLHFIDSNTGWAVGHAGMILKTIDGGTTWTAQSSGTTSWLYSVTFVDSKVGWAVGSNGAILKTTNGGTTWTAQSSGTTSWLYSVTFVDSTVGWAVGSRGVILKTMDSGRNWIAAPSGTAESLRSVVFIDATTGWAAGHTGTILKTTDGGTKWTAQTSGTGYRLECISFIDGTTGWAVGEGGTILKTVNGGITWSAQASGLDWSLRLNSVCFVDATTGWAVGSGGVVVKTTNGGTTWVKQARPTGPLYSIHFVDATRGWAVGDHGVIHRTTDGGATWVANSSAMTDSLWSVHFVNEIAGWAVGGGGAILKTTDGGTSWTVQDSGTTRLLLSTFFLDAEIGWVVGDRGTILKTVDGGASWTAQTSSTSAYLLGVFFLDADTGWAVGTAEVILKTTDGGKNWSTVRPPSIYPLGLRSIQFVDANTGWAVGSTGLLKSTDGGLTWTRHATGTGSGLERVRFVDSSIGWVVGQNGTILKTTDGGTTWAAQVSGTSSWLYSADFVDTMTGWVVGQHGTVLKTTDGGTTWTAKNSGAISTLRSVHLLDSHTGWSVGDGGTILRYRELPRADDDQFETTEGITLEAETPGVLTGDTDPRGASLTAHLAYGAANGEIDLAPDGSFTYTPQDGFFGTDTFCYRSHNGRDYSPVATVTLLVSPADRTIRASADGGGTISPAGIVSVAHGHSQTFTIAADSGYQVDLIVDGDTVQLIGETYTFADVSRDHAIHASFALKQYRLGYATSTGGSIEGETVQLVEHGSTGTTVTAVADTGCRFVSWSDGVLTPTRADTDVESDIAVTARFELPRSRIVVRSGSTTLAKHGDAYRFRGSLVDSESGAPIAGRQVRLQSSADKSNFKNTSRVATTGTDGTFSFEFVPRDRSFYRVAFGGDGKHGGAMSVYRRVTPRAFVSTPVAPATMYRGSPKRVYGSLKPRHPAGSSPVRLQVQRKVGTQWVKHSTVRAGAVNYSSHSRYRRALTFTHAGQYRIRAIHPADALHARHVSKWRYVAVR